MGFGFNYGGALAWEFIPVGNGLSGVSGGRHYTDLYNSGPEFMVQTVYSTPKPRIGEKDEYIF